MYMYYIEKESNTHIYLLKYAGHLGWTRRRAKAPKLTQTTPVGGNRLDPLLQCRRPAVVVHRGPGHTDPPGRLAHLGHGGRDDPLHLNAGLLLWAP